MNRHLPLCREIWKPFGLKSIDAFFPADDGAGFVALAVCRFRDTASFEAAIAAPRTAEIMADVQCFTGLEPVRYKLAAL